MRRIRVDDLPWTTPAAGIRSKSIVDGVQTIRLVEFAQDFAEAEWCCKSHTGYVLAGVLEVTFSDSTEVFSAGDVVVIRHSDRHRARVIEGPVRLFLVEPA